MNYTCRAVLLKSLLLPRLFYYLDQHIFPSRAMLSVDGRPRDVLNVGQVYVLIQSAVARGKGMGSEDCLSLSENHSEGSAAVEGWSNSITVCIYSSRNNLSMLSILKKSFKLFYVLKPFLLF